MVGRLERMPLRPRVHSKAPVSTSRTNGVRDVVLRHPARSCCGGRQEATDGGPVKPTVQTLLDRTELALTLLTPGRALPDGALDAGVPWAHSSDLADPTPFLEAGTLLLTTGTQFGSDSGSDDRAGFDAYVARLRLGGIVALGYGTEVVREGTPDELVAACTTHGLPLF